MYSLADLVELIEGLAVITTILQFLSGILVCRRYVSNGTTGEASPLPFTCGFLSCSLWLLYGMNKNDNNITLVNIVGVILMMSYVVVFYLYTLKKTVILRQCYGSLGLSIFAIVFAYKQEDTEFLLDCLGLIACTITVLTIAAPMTKLMLVVRTKCTECLPFPMILMSFIVSGLWFFYGIIEEDYYLTIPNFIGATLALAQLSLFAVYPSQQPSPHLLKTTYLA